MRENFTFFSGYWDVLKDLPTRDYNVLTKAIFEYVFEGKVPELKGVIKNYFSLMKPYIDASAERKKAGAPKGNQNAKKENNAENNSKNNSETIKNNPKNNSLEIEIEKEKEIEVENKRESKREKRAAFSPPSLDEVTQYCLERKNGINPQTFIDFYEAKGWMIGKEKMKDWKAAIRTWEARNKDAPKTQATVAATSVQKNKFVNFPQREWDFDAIMRAEEERRENKA